MIAVQHPTDFICPGCGAGYKVVRIKAEADPPHRLIHCKVCKRSLAPTDKEYILKYFLISRKQGAKQRV
jgi:transcription elongation factor Elf1